jgi:hypothetical protein
VNRSRLTLSAAGVVVDLGDHLDRHPSGGAAVLDDGIEGLGLPPVAPRFFDGAGDGSTYRGARVQPRDVTLPVLITAADRAALRERVSALATVLSPAHAPATLTYTEPDGTEWTTEVVRTGSGEPVTDGETSYAISVQLRAPDPYWTRERAAAQTIESAGAGRGLLRPGGSLTELRLASGQVMGSAVIENPGDAPAYPTVTLNGPATSFVFTSPSGEALTWSGDLAEGERRIFDHRAGTVVDAEGANRYAELGAAPRFWAVPPGVQSATVDVQGSSVGSVVVLDPPLRTNAVTDPRFTRPDRWEVLPAEVAVTAAPDGLRLTVGADLPSAEIAPVGPAAAGWPLVGGARAAARLVVHNLGDRELPVRLRLTFSAPAAADLPDMEVLGESVLLEPGAEVVLEVIGAQPATGTHVLPSLVAGSGTGLVAGDAVALRDVALLLDDDAPATGPVAYFDGDTSPTTDRAYAWSGQPDASTSVERATAIVGRTSVSVAWKPRRWFML